MTKTNEGYMKNVHEKDPIEIFTERTFYWIVAVASVTVFFFTFFSVIYLLLK